MTDTQKIALLSKALQDIIARNKSRGHYNMEVNNIATEALRGIQ